MVYETNQLQLLHFGIRLGHWHKTCNSPDIREPYQNLEINVHLCGLCGHIQFKKVTWAFPNHPHRSGYPCQMGSLLYMARNPGKTIFSEASNTECFLFCLKHSEFSRKTEPIRYMYGNLLQELAYTVIEAEKFHNLPYATWGPRKASGIMQSDSKSLRTRSSDV